MNDFTIEHFTKCLNSFVSKDNVNIYLKYINELLDYVNKHNFIKQPAVDVYKLYNNIWSLRTCKKCKLHIAYIAEPYNALELRLYTHFNIGEYFNQYICFSIYDDCEIEYTKEKLLLFNKIIKENTCKSRIMKLACY